MAFKDEAEFEEAVIKLLTNYSWEKNILKYPTEEELIDNWQRFCMKITTVFIG